ncbi:MAG: hypothetical protein IJ587_05105 [Synergistaceae bacterium]|nr:hypothetical protein [Synergistaceae bacterium]
MTSYDNTVFIREDVFNARMDAFMSEIKLENEKLRNELNSKIDTVQSSLNSKIDTVQSSLNSKIDNVHSSLTSKIESYQAQNERQFSELRGEIKILSTRMDGLDARMADLQNSISWSFTLAAAFIAVIGIIISVFIAFAPSIWSFVKRKRQPELSRSDVKSLVAEQVSETLKQYFNAHTDIQMK